MLIDNKFIFLSLPRCASTSFHISCLRNGLDVRHCNSNFDTKIDFDLSKVSNMELVYKIKHIHEEITELKGEFGYHLPVVSVKRDKYERFVSYVNHIIGELYRISEYEIYEKFKEIDVEYLMSFKKENIIDRRTIQDLIPNFLEGIGIKKYNRRLNTLFMPLFAPLSFYHCNHENIIWFDFNKLNELESWVSNICGIDFKLEVFGSSKEYKSKIIVDDLFKRKYDSIYETYENIKKQKSII